MRCSWHLTAVKPPQSHSTLAVLWETCSAECSPRRVSEQTALRRRLPLSGGASFNTLATDVNAASNVGRYNNTIQDFSVSVGTYFASFAPGNSFIRVTNSAPGAGNDIYELRVNGLFGSAVNGFTPSSFLLELTDPSGTAFSSDALPTSAPSLSSFARSEFRLLFGSASTRVQGALTSLVPLPAAVWLFGAGLVALVGLGSRGLVTRKES